MMTLGVNAPSMRTKYAVKNAAAGDADRAGLLRHHHGYGVAALRYAQRGAVAQTQVLGNVVE